LLYSLPSQVQFFSANYLIGRSYQKFSGRLKGLFRELPGKLASFRRHERFRKDRLMAKQTKITIETDSLLILRIRNSTRAWCPRCAAEREMIALDKTGGISNLRLPLLEEWLKSGDLHRSESADGSPLICLNSLLARVRNPKTR
jgi:hypothetical protein